MSVNAIGPGDKVGLMGIEILYGLGALLLLIALVWGASRYRSRRQGERGVGDRATDAMYRRSGDPEA